MSVLVEHDDSDDGNVSEVVVAKAVAMTVLFASSMVFGMLPMLLARRLGWLDDGKSAGDIKSSNRLVLGLLSFGGGVLLCTTFQHLLPEVGENVKELQDSGALPELPFNLESLLMCTGFFTMYLVEEVVHCYMHARARRTQESPLARALSVRRSRNNNSASVSTADLIARDPEKPAPPAAAPAPAARGHAPGHGHGHSHTHLPTAADNEDPVIASLRGLLVVLALSVHELFEGLAVGLESSASNVWYMFGAVAAHKLVIAFCVGVELVTARTRPLLTVVYVLTFAVVSPIGIGIGLALSGDGCSSASDLPSAILQGLASGTLLYVVFFEILQRERSGFIQFGSALVGFIVMFGLQFASGHEHSHGGCGEDEHEHGHYHSGGTEAPHQH